MAHLLDALGYSVLQSGERTDALRIAETRDDLALVISERSMANAAEEREWLAAVRRTNPACNHLALLEPAADATEVASDADAVIRHPIGVPELANSIRAALEHD